MKRLTLMAAAAIIAASMASCGGNAGQSAPQTAATQQLAAPEWASSANIYEVNVRQYTPEGTFKAFKAHLPRLKEQNVDILWLMPIYPISEEGRKGSLGSYYAVADYCAVNPEFGTLEDLKELVDEAHKLGMKVILDWVANHTGCGSKWVKEHKNWFNLDKDGNPAMPEGTDWSDVADLNYDVPEMRQAMVDALKFWIENANIDGFRCDMAGMVPTDFWIDARKQLSSSKNIFMLAEDNQKEILSAFDMAYGWEVHHMLNDIAQGTKNADSLKVLFDKMNTSFPQYGQLMNFTSNHDENSWSKTEYDRMGSSAEQMAVLTYFLPGMPLTYSGQEAASKKVLRFFDKDTIDFSQLPLKDFYGQLNKIKHEHKALWNGEAGGKFEILSSSKNMLVFERSNGDETITCAFNFNAGVGGAQLDIKAKADDIFGSGQSLEPGKQGVTVPAKGYKIFVSKKQD